MSTDITPFRSDCEHVLQKLPVIDMTLRFTCTQCGGIRDITADGIRDFGSYEALISQMLAELGGTIVNESTEPRRWEYPVGGVLNEVYANHEDIALLHLNAADIAFIEYLDAWIDKGLADGTLTVEKGARYREAIARRCAELGEAPHRRENLHVLSLKAGDILGIVSPSDSVHLMGQMARYTREILKEVGAEGTDVIVFPPGTEFHVLEGAAAQVPDKVRQFVDERIAAGLMTQEQFREMLRREIVAQGRW